jgi:hypothetical protein
MWIKTLTHKISLREAWLKKDRSGQLQRRAAGLDSCKGGPHSQKLDTAVLKGPHHNSSKGEPHHNSPQREPLHNSSTVLKGATPHNSPQSREGAAPTKLSNKRSNKKEGRNNSLRELYLSKGSRTTTQQISKGSRSNKLSNRKGCSNNTLQQQMTRGPQQGERIRSP